MAQSLDLALSILSQAETVIQNQTSLDDFTNDKQRQEALVIIGKFVSLPHVAAILEDIRLDSDYESIIKGFPISEIINIRAQIIANDQAQDANIEPDNSVPPELESLVAEYEENKEQQEHNIKTYSSTHAHIERAVKAMALRRRREVIFANRQANSEEEITDTHDQLVRIVSPRSQTYEEYSKYETKAISSFLQNYLSLESNNPNLAKLSDQILNLSLSGAVDLSDPRSLALATEIALYQSGQDSTLTSVFKNLDSRQAEKDQATSKLNLLEVEISHLNSSNEPDKEQKLQNLLTQVSNLEQSINSLSGVPDIDQELENKILTDSKRVLKILDDKIKNPDLVDNLKDIQTKHQYIYTSLVERGVQSHPLPTIDPLRINISDPQIGKLTLEQAIRLDLPAKEALLSVTGQSYSYEIASILASSDLKNTLSPEIIKLYSKGLTPEMWDKIIDHAAKNTKSYLGQLYASNPEIFGQIRRQINVISSTRISTFAESLSQSIKNKANSTLGQIYTAGGSFKITTKSGQTITGKDFIDKYAQELATSQQKAKEWLKQAHLKSRSGKSLKIELERIRKSALAQELEKGRNRLTQTTQVAYNQAYKTSVKLAKSGVSRAKNASHGLAYVFDPVGTLKKRLAEKLGAQVFGRIVRKYGSEELKQLLLSQGFKKTLKFFVDQSAKQLVLTAAKQAGVQAAKISAMAAADTTIAAVAAALGVSTAGLSLIIGAVLIVGGAIFDLTIGWINKLKKNIATSLYGEDVKARDILSIVGAWMVGTKAIKSAMAFSRTLPLKFLIASVFAVSSAAFTITMSAILVYFFYVTTLVVAPLISTLVNLDSQNIGPSAPLSCANMPWPFDGTHTITQGPNQKVNACTHKGSISQSADFSMGIGTPIKSMSDGKVIFAGLDPSSAGGAKKGYGYYVRATAKNDSGQEFQILYAHFSSVSVNTGDTIKAGQVIGLSGSTGYSTGPHLHLGYIAMDYNSCPAGGHVINDDCCDSASCNQP